jgi:hypothetical protein
MALFGWKSGLPPWAKKPGNTSLPSTSVVSNQVAPPLPAAPEIPAELVAYQCLLRQSSLRMQSLPPLVPPEPLQAPSIPQHPANYAEPAQPQAQIPVFPSQTMVYRKPGLIPLSQSKPGFAPLPAPTGQNPQVLLSSTASLPFFSAKFPSKPILSTCQICSNQVEQLYQTVRCPEQCKVCSPCMTRGLETGKCPGCLRILCDTEVEWLTVFYFEKLTL